MTRLAVLSDIHANLPALEAVLADMALFEVDNVIVAGDAINWGPFSVQVMERIAANHWAAIRGNHEFYMLDYNTPRAPEHWKEYVSPRWLNEHIPKKWRSYIAALPDTLCLRFPDAPPVRVWHGSPGTPWEGIYPHMSDDDILSRVDSVEEDTLIVGHIHLQMERRVRHWHVVNPGSVGLPLDGLPGACYMLLDGDSAGWKPTFRRVEYDILPLFAEFERIRFVEDCGATALLAMQEFRTSRPQIFPFNQWRKQVYPEKTETIEMVSEFLAIADISPYQHHAYLLAEGK